VILKEVRRNTAALPKLVRFRVWFIRAARLTSEMVSRTSPSKSVSAIFQIWYFFYNLLKCDIVNADVPFYKRVHNFETEAKLNNARHTSSNEVSLSILAEFQLIASEDVRKQTLNVHLHMQFSFIEKKMKNVSWDFHDKVLKIPACKQD